jgi:hypothetical protein
MIAYTQVIPEGIVTEPLDVIVWRNVNPYGFKKDVLAKGVSSSPRTLPDTGPAD